MGSAQFIKPITKTDFLKRITGKGKDDFLDPKKHGGVYDILFAFGNKMTYDLAEKLDEMNKTSSGSLIKSMKFHIDRFGGRYEFTFELNEYYKWVDKGRPKGKLPPFEAINKWAKDKKLALNTNRYNKYGVIQKKFKTFSKVDRVGIIDAIRWGIYKKGIKSAPFFSNTVEDGRVQRLSADISKALGIEVKIDMIKYIDEIKKGK